MRLRPAEWPFFVLISSLAVLVPLSASASIFSGILGASQATAAGQSLPISISNSQTLAAAIGPDSIDNDASHSTSDEVVINDAALAPSIGLSGNDTTIDTIPDTEKQISVYTVHKGDTLSSVAKMFDVSTSSIVAFNNLPSGTSSLKEGTVLNILPISGFMHTVTKGETLRSIASKYKVDVGDLAYNNDLSPSDDLMIGDTLIVPESKNQSPVKITPPSSSSGSGTSKSSGGGGKIPVFANTRTDLGDFWLRPIAGGTMTQDLHGARMTGIDLAAPSGTPIMAAADGVVLVALSSGYNTGYGEMVVINHKVGNLTVQTVYAHLSKVLVSPGQTVSRGQVIGKVGKTGRATGYHLHFEVDGAANPFHNDPDYGL